MIYNYLITIFWHFVYFRIATLQQMDLVDQFTLIIRLNSRLLLVQIRDEMIILVGFVVTNYLS